MLMTAGEPFRTRCLVDPLSGFRSISVSFVTDMRPDAVFRRTSSRLVIVFPVGISFALMRWKQLPVSMIQYDGLLSSTGGHARVVFLSVLSLRIPFLRFVELELALSSVLAVFLVVSLSVSSAFPGVASAL